MFVTTGMWETKVPVRWLLSDFRVQDGLNCRRAHVRRPARIRMRFLLCVLALLFASIHPFLAQRDAAGVLAEMREALGGAAALDAVKTFSANGSRTLSSPMGTRRLGLEWFALLPEHFLEIRRDSTTG